MFRSPFPDESVPAQSVFDFLFADLSPEDAARPALIDGASGAETSYGALKSGAEALAGAFATRGVGIGSVVALHCPNVPAFAIVFHGILRSGATATTLNALYGAEEIATQLTDSGATMLVTVSALSAASFAAAEKVGIPAERVVVLDGADGHPSLRDLLSEGAQAPEVNFDPATHVAVLPYSSGTTGIAKGVQLSHTNLVANVQQCNPVLDVTPADRVLALLPFFHIYGMTVLLNLALRRRATLVTMPRFDLPEFLRIIQDHRCSYVFIAPPVAVALAKHPLVDDYDLSSVRQVFSGAAPLDADLAAAVATRLKTRVRQGYGLTEASPVTHVLPLDQGAISTGSIGVTVPNTESRLVDAETGADIALPTSGRSAPGELWVRGPQVMLGYLNRPDATIDTIDSDGWLHTGDVASVGEHGEFFIVDRLKELIKYKGYQVAPAELEALLLTHPEVTDAAVIGVAHETSGEIPMAFVVRQEGSTLDEEQVMSFVAEQVAPHKKVRRVAFIEAIPKSSSGKILRKDLRTQFGS